MVQLKKFSVSQSSENTIIVRLILWRILIVSHLTPRFIVSHKWFLSIFFYLVHLSKANTFHPPQRIYTSKSGIYKQLKVCGTLRSRLLSFELQIEINDPRI